LKFSRTTRNPAARKGFAAGRGAGERSSNAGTVRGRTDRLPTPGSRPPPKRTAGPGTEQTRVAGVIPAATPSKHRLRMPGRLSRSGTPPKSFQHRSRRAPGIPGARPAGGSRRGPIAATLAGGGLMAPRLDDCEFRALAQRCQPRRGARSRGTSAIRRPVRSWRLCGPSPSEFELDRRGEGLVGWGQGPAWCERRDGGFAQAQAWWATSSTSRRGDEVGLPGRRPVACGWSLRRDVRPRRARLVVTRSWWPSRETWWVTSIQRRW